MSFNGTLRSKQKKSRAEPDITKGKGIYIHTGFNTIIQFEYYPVFCIRKPRQTRYAEAENMRHSKTLTEISH